MMPGAKGKKGQRGWRGVENEAPYGSKAVEQWKGLKEVKTEFIVFATVGYPPEPDVF